MKNRTPELLFVTHKYPPAIGGMQKQSYELIKGISKNVPIHKIVFNNKYPIVFFLLLSLPNVIIALWRYKSIRLIHANDALMALFLTPMLWLTKRKLVATVHGLDIVHEFAPFQVWVRKYLSKFDLIITVSEATRRECIKRGIDESKLVFIPNAFDFPKTQGLDSNFKERFEQTKKINLENKKILISVGRPVPRKGFLWFVENVLSKINGDVIYIIVGPRLKHPKTTNFLSKILPSKLFKLYCQLYGVTLDNIELDKKLKENPNERYQLAGKLSNDDLEQLYLHADLFVMPNLHVKGDFEGFGLVALEAVSRGTLCLAADVDGIPSAIKDKENGLLVASANAVAWAHMINELLERSDLNEMANGFKEALLAEGYDWNRMADDYHSHFQRLIHR